MALKWIEGFEGGGTTSTTLRTYLTRKYPTVSATTYITSGTGRFGGYCCKMYGNTYFQQSFSAAQTWVIGFAFRAEYFQDNYAIIELRDAGTVQVELVTINGGNLGIRRGTTTLGVTTNLRLRENVWYYAEVKVKIDNATGTYEVRVGGTNILSDTNVDTQVTGNATIDQIRFKCEETSSLKEYFFDDIYILDTAGALNNDFLGNVRVGLISPNGDTVDADFTPLGGGTNTVEVDDGVTVDDDTTYNQSATATHKDLFDYTALTNIPTIKGVMINTEARETDATNYSVKSIAESNGTEDADAGQALTSSYIIVSRIVEDDPDTGALWLLAAINAATFGYEAV